MTVTHTFAGLAVADYAAAYDWYARVLGRPADMFPHDMEAVWQLTPSGSIYVAQDSERAGSGVVALALDDLDSQEKRLRDGGLEFEVRTDGAVPRRLVVRDADGNALTFFQDPARSDI